MIPVFFCFDSNLQTHVAPAFNSVYLNTKAEIEFHAIVLSDVSMEYIHNYEHAGIHVHCVDTPDIQVNKCGIVQSPAMYLRWLIPYYTTASKAVYLDNDIIVLGDIADMYNVPLCSDLIGAVKDKFADTVGDTAHHQGVIPGASALPSYYSGQLVINCDAWRAEGITEKLFDIAQKYDTLDMVALNYVCAGRIYPLAPEWCVSAQYDEVPSYARLLHWHGRTKPWDRNAVNKKYYDEYAGGKV